MLLLMSPVIRTVIFTGFVLGFWTVAVPYWLLPRGARPDLRGAGAGDPPKKLVAEGPYGVVRNPLYWSVALVLLGEAAVFHALALADCAIVYFVVASLFVLVFEEPELRWKFGAEYEEYCQRVPRWLPRLRTK